MDELGDDLSVGLGLESVAALLQERLDVLVVGDDTVVNDHEAILLVRTLWMRVEFAGWPVSGPTRMRNATMLRNNVIDVAACNLLGYFIFQHLHLAGLLEEQNALSIFTVNGNASRIIATIFETLQTGDEILEHLTTSFRC